MYSDHLENEALEDCETCCCCCVQCKDNIVELNWVDPSWVLIHVLFLCGRQGKGNKEEGEGERIRGTRGRGREGEREKMKWVGCQNRGLERREEGRGGEGREEGVEEERRRVQSGLGTTTKWLSLPFTPSPPYPSHLITTSQSCPT